MIFLSLLLSVCFEYQSSVWEKSAGGGVRSRLSRWDGGGGGWCGWCGNSCFLIDQIHKISSHVKFNVTRQVAILKQTKLAGQEFGKYWIFFGWRWLWWLGWRWRGLCGCRNAIRITGGDRVLGRIGWVGIIWRYRSRNSNDCTRIWRQTRRRRAAGFVYTDVALFFGVLKNNENLNYLISENSQAPCILTESADSSGNTWSSLI